MWFDRAWMDNQMNCNYTRYVENSLNEEASANETEIRGRKVKYDRILTEKRSHEPVATICSDSIRPAVRFFDQSRCSQSNSLQIKFNHSTNLPKLFALRDFQNHENFVY